MRDSKVEAYLPPFFMRSKGEAMRVLVDTLDDANHLFHKHPDDYYLYHIGEFDDQTGIFIANASPEPVCSCVDLISRPDHLLKPELVKEIGNA